MTLRLEPGDSLSPGASRPRGMLRHTPKPRRAALPGTTVQPRSDSPMAHALEVVREAWREERARRLALIARECEEGRASIEARHRAHARTIYRTSPARRANWLDRRLTENAARWTQLYEERAAAEDRPAPTDSLPRGSAGVSWYASHSDRATATVREATGEPRVAVEVLGDEAWQAQVLHALWALADSCPPAPVPRPDDKLRVDAAPLTLVP